MFFDLEQMWIDINCPNCKYSFDVQMIDAKLQSTVICNNCKANIQLVDQTASIHTSIKSINQSLKDLENIFKNFK
jgi:transcription initiation factor IIE alpha subunit